MVLGTLIYKVVLASLVDAVDYPTPAAFFTVFNGTDTLLMNGGSNIYASNVSIYYEGFENEMGSAYPATVTENGDYKVKMNISGTTYLTEAVAVTVPPPIPTPTNPIAFHYGDFDNVYGDVTVSNAATNGRVFANTPTGTYSWGTLDTVANTTTNTTYTWTPLAISTPANVLMVAGGGGGGGRTGGGGGAGGLILNNSHVIAQTTITISIGNSGNGGPGGVAGNYGTNGYDTSFTGLTTVKGGGTAGSYSSSSTAPGISGGSGGGGGRGSAIVGGSGTPGQGNNGGSGNNRCGGGGGAITTGGSGASNPGGGGNGRDVSTIFTTTYGVSGYFSGGGGAGGGVGALSSTPAPGGVGGGGNGSIDSGGGGTRHTGGGGGGGGYDGNNGLSGGSGGSGIVIISYIIPKATLAFHYGDFDSAYGDITVSNAATNGRVFANTPTGTYSWGTLTAAANTTTNTTYTWTPKTVLTADVLMVAGGGGGGGALSSGAGGAGGLLFNEGKTLSGQKTIVVGNGGLGGEGTGGSASGNAFNGVQGNNTSFTDMPAICIGGGGGTGNSGTTLNAGGSGGGGRNSAGGSSTTDQGFNGGLSPGLNIGGGGGGAGSVGLDATTTKGGNGGNGVDYIDTFGTIYGDSGYFASGGGGGGRNTTDVTTIGTASIGGGTSGTQSSVKPAPAKSHTGGGGGGGGFSGHVSGITGGTGGSGIVLISYIIPTTTLAFHYGDFDSAYGDVTVSNAATNGRVFANTPTGTYSWGTLSAAANTTTNTTYTWTPKTPIITDVLMVAGGGGGGGVRGGGGGAGGLLFHAGEAMSGQKIIVVGSGGLGGKGNDNNPNEAGYKGSDTTFTGLTTVAGGGGAGAESNGTVLLQSGGSGGSGGGGAETVGRLGGTATPAGQGNAGGACGSTSTAGGGGGAGSVGGNSSSGIGGNGGTGYLSTFGVTYGDDGYFASGGGGGVNTGTPGTASQGGGTNGKVNTVKADDAQRHTGGGGGGTGYNGQSNSHLGGSGGSGIVLLSYRFASQLIHDSFDKLTVANTSNVNTETKLRLGSNVWDLGAAGTVYICKPGAYKSFTVDPDGQAAHFGNVTVESVTKTVDSILPEIYESPQFTSNSAVADNYKSVYGWDTNIGWKLDTRPNDQLYNANESVHNAFDKQFGASSTSYYHTNYNQVTDFPKWIVITFPEKVSVFEYKITPRTGNNANQTFVRWELQGSDDYANWTVLNSQTVAGSSWVSGVTQTFTFTNTTSFFEYYRFYILQGNFSTYFSVGEIRIFCKRKRKLPNVPLLGTLAFHHGNFVSDYGDVTVSNAATNGHVFANTPLGTYDWGTLTGNTLASTGTTYTWTPVASFVATDVLMVAGGGGGGGTDAGGGGAGGLLLAPDQTLSGQKTIVIGNGGLGGLGWNNTPGYGQKGSDTSITGLTSAKGGGGGGNNNLSGGETLANRNGGSGGGDDGVSNSATGEGGTAESGQGFPGGVGMSTSPYSGGGGGGAGGVGGTGVAAGGGGGGLGINYTTTFTNKYGDIGYFASGGGGGSRNTAGGIASFGGGTSGTTSSTPAADAKKHTGGGGGGASYSSTSTSRTGGDGGSGIVLINNVPFSGILSASLSYDGYNKLSVNGVDAQTLYEGSNSYSLGTASSVYIADPGEYTYFTRTLEYALLSNVTVGAVTQNLYSYNLFQNFRSINYVDASGRTISNLGSYSNGNLGTASNITTFQAALNNNGWTHNINFYQYTGDPYSTWYNVNEKTTAVNFFVGDVTVGYIRKNLPLGTSQVIILYYNPMTTSARPISCKIYKSVGNIIVASDTKNSNQTSKPNETILNITDSSEQHYIELSEGHGMIAAEYILYVLDILPQPPSLTYDGITSLKVLNPEASSYITYKSYDTGKQLGTGVNETSYDLHKPGNYKALVSGATTFTITNNVLVPAGEILPLYKYPPTTGTTPFITESTNIDTNSIWTRNGALYGNWEYRARASITALAGHTAYAAFNNNLTEGFISAANTGTLSLEFPTGESVLVRKYVVRPDVTTTTRPKSWTLQGSQDNVNWITVHTVVNTPPSLIGDALIVTSPAAYKMYRLNVTANNGGTGLTITELQLYGDIPFNITFSDGWISTNGPTALIVGGAYTLPTYITGANGVTKTGDTIDINTIGKYNVIYSHFDVTGVTKRVMRTFDVVSITFSDLWTSGETNITVGSTYSFPVPSSPTSTVTYINSSVNRLKRGSYSITYTASDSTVTRIYNVVGESGKIYRETFNTLSSNTYILIGGRAIQTIPWAAYAGISNPYHMPQTNLVSDAFTQKFNGVSSNPNTSQGPYPSSNPIIGAGQTVPNSFHLAIDTTKIDTIYFVSANNNFHIEFSIAAYAAARNQGTSGGSIYQATRFVGFPNGNIYNLNRTGSPEDPWINVGTSHDYQYMFYGDATGNPAGSYNFASGVGGFYIYASYK